ncbi:MAG: SPFH domain-containing protein [Capsulimonadales bacterium]|nr:SPFH domain-containing protein [Capsulimonadales bacterium]
MKVSKVGCLTGIGVGIVGTVLFFVVSLAAGGHMPGPTYIAPGNVGLRIDNYKGVVQDNLMPSGVHFQGIWETVIEVPTMQRTLSFDGDGAIDVNTSSNMLTADVTVQYNVRGDKARALYTDYQDTFADLAQFESINVRPAIKEAVNYAMGDLDTAAAMTTEGKTKAEEEALARLRNEWGPRGVEFHNLLIRAVEPDAQAKALLSATTAKMQDIENAKLALKQQEVENQTLIRTAQAEARINNARDSSLTDLYIQDKMLQRVDTIYLPSDRIMGMLNK